jgi:hypothetical protein
VYFVGPFAYGAYLMTDVAGHKNNIVKWENVRNATIVDGKLVPGALIPCPASSCGSTSPSEPEDTEPAPAAPEEPAPSQPSAPAPSSGSVSSLWSASDTPVTASDPDTNAVELGTKFSTNVAGKVTGVRFYKGSQNTGTHTGSLWSASGSLLATGTFTNESASGWQTLTFSSPVSISANTTYVVSYHTNVGRYAGDRDYFGSARTSGPITAPRNAGVYKYGAGGFPNQSYESSNYWVDVLFVPEGVVAGASYSPLAIGDTVKTKANLNVRSAPNGAIVGVASLGSAGTVQSAPQSAGGITWLRIAFQNGLSGWSSAGYLTR